MKKLRLYLIKYFKCLDIVDYFLFLFMIILMSQTVYNLFMNETIGNKSVIDTALRTTTSGLFGYYIGKGFIQGDSVEHNIKKDMKDTAKDNSLQLKNINHSNSDDAKSRRNIQIILVGSLGVIALAVLIITRNTSVVTNEKTATLSQLRDIVSGSTCFLISQTKR